MNTGEHDTVLQGVLRRPPNVRRSSGSITLAEGDDHRFVTWFGPAIEPYLGTLIEPTGGRRAEQFGSLDDHVFSVDDFASIVTVEQLLLGSRSDGRRPQLHLCSADRRAVSARRPAAHVPPRGQTVRRGAESERPRRFAGAASLAIGNAQLFDDLDQALDGETTLADVLEAVDRRPTSRPVFDRISIIRSVVRRHHRALRHRPE